MNEPTNSEPVKADLPSPKPNRRKRLALRFAVLVAAVSLLGAAYWFTRPPELVWWRSQAIGRSGRHVHALVPQGWKLYFEAAYPTTEESQQWDFEAPVDLRPRLLGWLFPHIRESGSLSILIQQSKNNRAWADIETGTKRSDVKSEHTAHQVIVSGDGMIYEDILYRRANLPAFNRTYRQICNSLTIE